MATKAELDAALDSLGQSIATLKIEVDAAIARLSGSQDLTPEVSAVSNAVNEIGAVITKLKA